VAIIASNQPATNADADIDLSCAEAAPTNHLRSNRSDALRRRSAGSTKVWRAATVSADLTLGVGVVEVDQHGYTHRCPGRGAGSRVLLQTSRRRRASPPAKARHHRWRSARRARAAPMYGVISPSFGAGECRL
jgi:hypothetical protein